VEEKDPEMDPHSYGHLIFDKGTNNIYCRKDSYSTNAVGKTGYPHVED
jgi:hypothetical protein